MPACSAHDCTERSGPGLFELPKDPELRKKWVKALKRKNFVPGSASRVCKKHFSDDCFVYKPSLMACTGLKFRYKLLPNAVPTLFSYNNYTDDKENKAPKRQYMLKKIRQAVSN